MLIFSAFFNIIYSTHFVLIWGKNMAEENNKNSQDVKKRSAYNLAVQISPGKDRCRIVNNNLGPEQGESASFSHSRYLDEILKNHIHPEDREEYRRFWKGEAIHRLLNEEGYTSFLSHDFRYLQKDGTWGWREELVLPVRQGEEEADLFCFIRDIHI